MVITIILAVLVAVALLAIGGLVQKLYTFPWK